MYPAIASNQYHFPPLHRITMHAKFLCKNLPVKHCQAQEMIAFYYGFKNWNELNKGINNSIPPQFSNSAADHIDAEIYRRHLFDLLTSDWNSHISKVQNMILIPNTVSHAVAHFKLDWLHDDEVLLLHDSIFEGESKPVNNLYVALSRADNNILTPINRMMAEVKSIRSGHIHDFRYGFTFYFNVSLVGNSIKLIIRELDNLFLPPSNTLNNDKIFHKNWFKNHVIGYLYHLIDCLKQKFPSGKIILHRVSNHDSIICSNSSRSKSIGFMKDLETELKSLGAGQEYLFGEEDSRIGISIPF